MNHAQIIDQLCTQLRAEFAHESTGHDWFHIERVWRNAKLIAASEGGDLFLIELAALLHDIADHKFVENADEVAEARITSILKGLGVASAIIDKVVCIVKNSSYKGGTGDKMELLEGLIIQDADRLDAIGAIGIARAFAFGGKFDRLIYDPSIAPSTFATAQEYRDKRTHTINHFYEKLLLLKDKMNTKTGRALAEDRHRFIETFLEQFYAEWQGKL